MEKILIVDDEKTILDLLEEVLVDEGYSVIKASNGIEGIEKVKSEQPDLVITDLMMPCVDGYHMISRIVNEEYLEKNPEFIILTVRSKVLDDGLGKRVGASVYLEKPFKRKQLLQKVREVLKK